MPRSNARVLIVGAGPTGLTLALLLARHKIPSTLVERNTAPQSHPAACILDTRTMEVFREIGVAETILASCQDVFERARITWVTTLAGRELGHCSALPDDVPGLLELSPVHATHYPQNRLEPLLWDQVRQSPLIEFLCGHECVAVEQSPTDVTISLRTPRGRVERGGTYLVVCDGAPGTLRAALGIDASGRALQHMIGVYFTADLGSLVNHRKSILYWVFNRELVGVLIAQWLPTEWVLFTPYFPPQQSADEFTDSVCRALVERTTGCAVADLQIKLVRPWLLSAKLADRYRQNRTFVAGDAAHSFPPTGGLGLNTGVQDAHNLAWKLAAVIARMSDESLLDTYEEERRPIAQTNLEHSVRNYDRMDELTRIAGVRLSNLGKLHRLQRSAVVRALPLRWQRSLLDAVIHRTLVRFDAFDRDDDSGERAREKFNDAIAGQTAHYRFLGLDLGFTYARGAFVAESSPKPQRGDGIVEYRPTTWPSARLPHLFVVDHGVRRSLHDVLAAGRLTLFVHEAGAQAWGSALSRLSERLRGAVVLLVIGDGAGSDLADSSGRWRTLAETDSTGAVLVRPDGHVAWRARTLPQDASRDLMRAIGEVLRLQS